MKNSIGKIFLVALTALLATAVLAEKPGYKKYTGQYQLSLSSGGNYTVILARDGFTTMQRVGMSYREYEDPIAGKVKFWKSRQEIKLLYPMYTFSGFANSLDQFTGDWIDIGSSNAFGSTAVLSRLDESTPVFHVKFMKSSHRDVKGDVFYNYGKTLKAKDFCLLAYYLPEGGSELEPRKGKKLTRLGFFRQTFPRFDRVDIFVVRKDYAEQFLLDYPTYTQGNTPFVDGKNILGFGTCGPGYKQPRDVYKGF